MKNPINEVVFPLCGEWKAETYAWSKELARLLHAPFRVLRGHSEPKRITETTQQLLEGDGYFLSHYQPAPIKTNVSDLRGDFDCELFSFLKERTTSMVVMAAAALNSRLLQDILSVKRHGLISIPDHIQKITDATEFNVILRQITFHHLPFSLFRPENYALIYPLTQGIRSFL